MSKDLRQPAIDPVDFAILSQSLTAAAREMGVKLIRSAYSTILREARDGSAAILDAEGRTVAQAELIPMHLGSIGPVARACLDAYPVETITEDDILLINDPYSGGQHLQDIFIFNPIFFEGRLLGFAASVAHHIDISGGAPGLNTAAQDVYAEGLILPPMKLNLARDWENGPFRKLIAANVRVPHQTMGDIDAQLASNRVGILRMRDLAARYGADLLLTAMAELQAYSETRMRAAIRDLPDGIYEGEDRLDDDGLGGPGPVVKARLIVKGDTINVDYEGTSPQVRSSINSPFASSISATVSCLKAALTTADIPFNDGAMRPITVTAPKGCLLNPHHPAPVRSRQQSCSRAFNATMKALAAAAPDKAISCGYDTTTAFCLSHLGETGWLVYLEVMGGGFGASATTDGCDAVDNPLSNCSNTPVEASDRDFPFFRLVGAGLRPGTGGAGRHRGGLGFFKSYEILETGTKLAFYSDRFTLAADGLEGGAPGSTGGLILSRDGTETALPSRGTWELRRGDVVTVLLGGGAGYGPIASRSDTAIAQDLEDGLITA